MSDRTGFLEESPGVRSMTRLTILVLLLLTGAIVGVTCWYVVKGTPKGSAPDAAVLGALAGIIGALVLNGVVAIVKRHGGDDAA